jgi:hypothetical protein
LKRPRPEPELHVKQGGILALSGPGLVDLLTAVLGRKRSFRFRAKGYSMAPFIRDGDVITLAPLGNTPPRMGEVVAYVNPTRERLVVHRVVARRGNAFLIKSDNESRSDGLVPCRCILGRVTRVERDGRHVRFGLGSDRIPMAILHRSGLLLPLLRVARMLLGPFRRRTDS